MEAVFWLDLNRISTSDFQFSRFFLWSWSLLGFLILRGCSDRLVIFVNKWLYMISISVHSFSSFYLPFVMVNRTWHNLFLKLLWNIFDSLYLPLLFGFNYSLFEEFCRSSLILKLACHAKYYVARTPLGLILEQFRVMDQRFMMVQTTSHGPTSCDGSELSLTAIGNLIPLLQHRPLALLLCAI